MEIGIIKMIQSLRSSFFDSFFEAVTMLGEEMVYILIFSVAYWCFNKREAIKMILIFLLSAMVNNFLKGVIMRDRPVGVEGVFSLREETATGSSMPSGHTQLATTFYYYLILKFKNRWVTIVGSILIVLVALSRIYLGVHWPSDVLVGIVVGIVTVHLGIVLFKGYSFKSLLITLLVSNLLLIPVITDDLVVSVALITGAIVGVIVEEKYVQFSTKTTHIRQLVKVLIGLVVVIVIKEGVKIITPDIHLFDYVRYLLIGLWVSAGAPYVYKLMKL